MATNLREDPRSIPTLLGEVARDAYDLMRQEIALAKAEAFEKVSTVQTGVAALAIGGAVAFAGLLVLLDACVFALGNALGSTIVERYPALPALIVGIVVAAIGIVMVSVGAKKFSAGNLRMTRTLHSVERDKAVVEEHLK
jgi:xanthine/uracil permease